MRKLLLVLWMYPLTMSFAATDPEADAELRHARALLQTHPLIDGHNDLPYVIREQGKPLRDIDAYDLRKTTSGDTDLARMKQGGVGAQFWSVFIPSTEDVKKAGFARIQLEQIDIARRMIERYPETLRLALTADDIEQANRAGRIASLLGWETGFAKASGVKFGDERYDEARAKYSVQHPEPRATISDVADHIEYMRKVAGVDHVAIGSDFFGAPTDMATGLEDASRYPFLYAELIRRGWNDDDLIKISRANLLRVLLAAERAATEIQRSRPASYLTIEELDRGSQPPLY